MRTSQWLKIKTARVSEGTVAELLLDKDKDSSCFSSLVVGIHDNNSYRYIGLVEAGIKDGVLKNILARGKATNKSIFFTGAQC
jgi:ATP-dependent DNA ligase